MWRERTNRVGTGADVQREDGRVVREEEEEERVRRDVVELLVGAEKAAARHSVLARAAQPERALDLRLALRCALVAHCPALEAVCQPLHLTHSRIQRDLLVLHPPCLQSVSFPVV